MGFSLVFKNLGHFFATGAKYVSVGIGDVLKFANKAQPLEPEVALVAAAIGGPLGSSITNLAFNALGTIAAALEPVGTDTAAIAVAQSQLSSAGLLMDAQTILDIKAAAIAIEQVIKTLGGIKPSATPAAK
jgi:broad specificity polyphosphatase/5'/3'-nucleotidase SurE